VIHGKDSGAFQILEQVKKVEEAKKVEQVNDKSHEKVNA